MTDDERKRKYQAYWSFKNLLNIKEIQKLFIYFAHNARWTPFSDADDLLHELFELRHRPTGKVETDEMHEAMVAIGRRPDNDILFSFLPDAIDFVNYSFFGVESGSTGSIVPPHILSPAPNIFLFTGAKGGAGKTTTCITFMDMLRRMKISGTCLEMNDNNQDLWDQLFLGLANGQERTVKGIEKWKYCSIYDSPLLGMARKNMTDVLGRIRETYVRIDDVIDLLLHKLNLDENARNILVDLRYNVNNLADAKPTFNLGESRNFPWLGQAKFMVFHALWPTIHVNQGGSREAKEIEHFCAWMQAQQSSFCSNKNIIWVLNPCAHSASDNGGKCQQGAIDNLRNSKYLQAPVGAHALFNDILLPSSKESKNQSTLAKYQNLAKRILDVYKGRPINVFIFSKFHGELQGFPRDIPLSNDPETRAKEIRNILTGISSDLESQWTEYNKYLIHHGEKEWNLI